METKGNQQDSNLSVEQKKTEENWNGSRITKNLIVVSLAFFVNFTAFQALSNLQSSLNCDAGLGLASLSTIYVTLILSAIFVPSIVIKYLGLKWTIVASMSCYAIYTGSNFYPSWWTLIPASVLVGLGAAPLWSAKCTYLITIGIMYADRGKNSRDAIFNRFFGVFFLFFQISQVLGNLISSLIFQQDTTIKNSTGSENFTCGPLDCHTETGVGEVNNITDGSYCELNKPPADLTNILLAIYTGCGILAMLIIAFLLDPLHPSEVTRTSNTKQLLGATLNLLKNKRLLLMIPLTMYSGFEQAFVSGDFTKSYVTCTIGVAWVGYVMICYGITDAPCSFLSGQVEKYTGRIPLFAFAAIVHITLIAVLLTWYPQADNIAVLFVLAGVWGLTDAIWQTQINGKLKDTPRDFQVSIGVTIGSKFISSSYYGVLFMYTQEAAFSNYRLWESVGFTFAFAYSNFLCVWVKLYILLGVLLVGMAGYFVTEFAIRNR